MPSRSQSVERSRRGTHSVGLPVSVVSFAEWCLTHAHLTTSSRGVWCSASEALVTLPAQLLCVVLVAAVYTAGVVTSFSVFIQGRHSGVRYPPPPPSQDSLKSWVAAQRLTHGGRSLTDIRWMVTQGWLAAGPQQRLTSQCTVEIQVLWPCLYHRTRVVPCSLGFCNPLSPDLIPCCCTTVQATYNSFGEVKEEGVYQCTGHPSPKDVRSIVEGMVNNDFEAALAEVARIKNENGLAIQDILAGLRHLVHCASAAVQNISLPPPPSFER